jgi:hypothetical protein
LVEETWVHKENHWHRTHIQLYHVHIVLGVNITHNWVEIVTDYRCNCKSQLSYDCYNNSTRYQGIIKLFVARTSVFGATWLMMLSIKCIITSITACPIQFAAILAIKKKHISWWHLSFFFTIHFKLLHYVHLRRVAD